MTSHSYKEFIIHTGVKKQVSNNSSIWVIYSKVAPPPKLLLSKKNVATTQFALPESCCEDDNEGNL